MNKVILTLVLLLSACTLPAHALTGREVLENIDKNMVVTQAESVTVMVIHSRSGTRTIRSRAWSQGQDKAFVEYLSPPREKGKKMLKLADKIWTYTPEPNDRIITIAGHLLRQSVMGSDLSYEDMTENNRLAETYEAVLEGEDKIRDRNCFVLKLTATQKDVAYHTRKVWVDQERWLPLKEERFARSGRLLKTFQMHEVFKQGDRWYPKRMVFKDMLSRGKGTEYIIESIDFDVTIPQYKFTKAALRK
jgi:outer membrane lipoprotein-sorting protein